jgi:hypothetical protein
VDLQQVLQQDLSGRPVDQRLEPIQ